MPPPAKSSADGEPQPSAPQVPAPQPSPLTTVLIPMLSWYSASAEPALDKAAEALELKVII